MRISDWSSDVCSSDLHRRDVPLALQTELIDFGLLGSGEARTRDEVRNAQTARNDRMQIRCERTAVARQVDRARLEARRIGRIDIDRVGELIGGADAVREVAVVGLAAFDRVRDVEERSEEHTSELQSLMRI